MTKKADSAVGASPKSSSKAVPPHKKKTAGAVAHVGSTITLGGNESPGENLAVTLVKWVPNTTSTDQYTKPSPGKHFAAAQLRLHNLGKSAYRDSPSNGATVLDAKGQSYSAAMAIDVEAVAGFANGQVAILPGNTALGVVVFEVPAHTHVVKLQFGTDSSFGDVGQWMVH